MTERIGGEIIAAQLAAEGVDRVFGIVDGTYLGLLAGLERHGIRLISPRHETSAAHMAGAYARLTGRLGVCLASNGPGVANVLPGVAVENGEGNRVLLLTSCRRRLISGEERPGAYQAFDQTGVIGPMARWSRRVPDPARLSEMLRDALRASFEGRPGVVHLDVPEDVINGPVSAATVMATGSSARPARLVPSAADVKRAAELLASAERPLIHAGSGVIHAEAWGELSDVAELLASPVSSSWGARASLADDHPFSLPLWALEVVGQARRTADVVLVLGSRLGETDWWGRPPHWASPEEQRCIRVDLESSALDLNRPADVGIVADVQEFLTALADELRKSPLEDSRRQARRAAMAKLAEARAATRRELDEALQNRAAPVPSPQVPAACREVYGDDAVFVVDGGNTAVWCSFYAGVRSPNTILSTFKFGMLGAGVGQALGARAARPDSEVVCILGDGAMGFHLQEIETAVREKLPVTFVVLCDRQWGMVKITQHLGLPDLRAKLGTEAEEPINTDFEEIAFDRLAESMGAHGERVSDPEQLVSALQRCREAGKAAVLHVDVDPNLHLFAPGLQEFKAMHAEPAP